MGSNPIISTFYTFGLFFAILKSEVEVFMKKLMILKAAKEDLKAAKKQAKLVKKLHEKLWGKNTCEVVVIEKDQELFILADDDWNSCGGSLACRQVNPAPDVEAQTC